MMPSRYEIWSICSILLRFLRKGNGKEQVKLVNSVSHSTNKRNTPFCHPVLPEVVSSRPCIAWSPVNLGVGPLIDDGSHRAVGMAVSTETRSGWVNQGSQSQRKYKLRGVTRRPDFLFLTMLGKSASCSTHYCNDNKNLPPVCCAEREISGCSPGRPPPAASLRCWRAMVGKSEWG
jgi:hypothetical protein